MARGSTKNSRKGRTSGGDKYGKERGSGSAGVAGTIDPRDRDAPDQDLDGTDLVGWLNCECFFSLVLVGLLAALPFNLHTNDLLASRESYAQRAAAACAEGAWEQAAALYRRAVAAEETAEGHAFLAETLVRTDRAEEALAHYARAAELYAREAHAWHTRALSEATGGGGGAEGLLPPGGEEGGAAPPPERDAAAAAGAGGGAGPGGPALAAAPAAPALAAALAAAGKLQRELGRPEEAARSYRRALELRPPGGEEAPEVAEAHLQVAAALLDGPRPRHEEDFAQLGLHGQSVATRCLTKYSDAKAACKKTVVVAQDALVHLEAAAQRAAGGHEAAGAHLLAAHALRDLGRPDQALARYKKVIKHRPRDAGGLAALGAAYRELGQWRQALLTYRKALSLAPNSPEIQYVIAALQGPSAAAAPPSQEAAVVRRAPAAHLGPLFDLAARRAARARHLRDRALAEEGAAAEGGAAAAAAGAAAAAAGGGEGPAAAARRLAEAEAAFRAAHGLLFDGLPELMAEMVAETTGLRPGVHWLDVLDLGCGGGAAGRAVGPLASRLVGVDASRLALDQARQGGGYDELKHGDFLLALQNLVVDFDLIVACDSFPYFGDLQELLSLAARALRPGGLLIFNADAPPAAASRRGAVGDGQVDGEEEEEEEEQEEEEPAPTLEFTGRWAHPPALVRAWAARAGLRPPGGVSRRARGVRGESWYRRAQPPEAPAASAPGGASNDGIDGGGDDPIVIRLEIADKSAKTNIYLFELASGNDAEDDNHDDVSGVNNYLEFSGDDQYTIKS